MPSHRASAVIAVANVVQCNVIRTSSGISIGAILMRIIKRMITFCLRISLARARIASRSGELFPLFMSSVLERCERVATEVTRLALISWPSLDWFASSIPIQETIKWTESSHQAKKVENNFKALHGCAQDPSGRDLQVARDLRQIQKSRDLRQIQKSRDLRQIRRSDPPIRRSPSLSLSCHRSASFYLFITRFFFPIWSSQAPPPIGWRSFRLLVLVDVSARKFQFVLRSFDCHRNEPIQSDMKSFMLLAH